MRMLIALCLALFSGAAGSQFKYAPNCVDDPAGSGKKICQSYHNLGPTLCDGSGHPAIKLYQSDFLPTGEPPSTIYFTRVFHKVIGQAVPNGGSVLGYMWYPGGYYDTCAVFDGQYTCEVKPPEPGIWMRAGDWFAIYVNCGDYGAGRTHTVTMGTQYWYKPGQ